MVRPYTRADEQLAVKKGSKFTKETLLAIAEDLKSGRYLTKRTHMTDDMVSGLRYMIIPSGQITLYVHYFVGDERFQLKIGVLNDDSSERISLSDARHLAKTIKALADKGINPQDGLLKRLRRELMEKGTAWRPGK